MKKYTLYAIGEILLVVIGILIALQINNWNEERKAITKSHEILKEIKNNIIENIKLGEELIQSEKEVIQSGELILHNLNHIKTYHDSLDHYFFYSHFWAAVSLRTSGYETLKSVGIDLIESDTIQKGIVNLYELTYNEIDEMIRFTEGFAIATVVPFYSRNFIIGQRTAKPIDYKKLLTQKEFRGILNYWKGYRNHAIEVINNGMKEGELLVTLINQELEN